MGEENLKCIAPLSFFFFLRIHTDDSQAQFCWCLWLCSLPPSRSLNFHRSCHQVVRATEGKHCFFYLLQHQCLCSEPCQYCILADCKYRGVHKGRATAGGIDLLFTTAVLVYPGGNGLKRSEHRPLLNFAPQFWSSVLKRFFCDCPLGWISAYWEIVFFPPLNSVFCSKTKQRHSQTQTSKFTKPEP